MILRKDDDRFNALRLRTLLSELVLTGSLSIERVAQYLGTSPRTLQRRLANRQRTYRDFVDEVRLTWAQTLLCKTDTPVHEIAQRLGYRNPNAFSRAFRRWTGTTPRAYRAAVRQSSASKKCLARNGQTSQ